MRDACGSPRSEGSSFTESKLVLELPLDGTVKGSRMPRRKVNVIVMSAIYLSKKK